MDIPKWAQHLFSSEDAKMVSAAIKEVEEKTSGEIVALVVRRSSLTGHVYPFLLCLFLLAWLSFWVSVMFLTSSHYALIDLFTTQVILLIALSFALINIAAFFLSRMDWIQNRMTSPHDLDLQCQFRAEREFYRLRMQNTKKSTGVLIFISLMEREVVVLGDKSISKMIANETWSGLVKTITTGISSRQAGKSLCKAIEECGRILSESFPRDARDTNELSNTLVFRD